MLEEYIKVFIDKDYPEFIDKYLTTKTMNRIKYISQFCGCDYTNLYSPLFFYSRFDHSLSVAHMTWHFTHDKKTTIAALLHDCGTPCFAHCIDYVFGDFVKQESSEKSIVKMLKEDKELCNYLKQDDIKMEDLECLNFYPLLDNKIPKLCTDRLDGVLHTVYIWLHTHPLKEIKEVYNNIVVLENEEGEKELGFTDRNIALKFVKMVSIYAKELQGNTDKFVMKYISDIVKIAVNKRLITLEELYIKKEREMIDIFAKISSWKKFQKATTLIKTENKPKNYFISFDTKRRNVIPLIRENNKVRRISEIVEEAKKIYQDYECYQDSKYAYLEEIKSLD